MLDNSPILLLEGIHPRAEQVLAELPNARVLSNPDSLSGSELLQATRDVAVLGIRSRTKLDADFFAHRPDLRAVACFCIGTNQVDLAAAARAGWWCSMRPTPTRARSPSWLWQRLSC